MTSAVAEIKNAGIIGELVEFNPEAEGAQITKLDLFVKFKVFVFADADELVCDLWLIGRFLRYRIDFETGVFRLTRILINRETAR